MKHDHEAKLDGSNGVNYTDGNGLDATGADSAMRNASLGELFGRLSGDTSNLVQQEIQLAKTELRQTASTLAEGAAKVGIAAALALPGMLAITAAAIIALGILINSYWVSALIVGVLVLAVAGMMIKTAVAGFKSGFAPEQTIETLKEDAAWAKTESQRVKQRLSA